MFYNFGCALAMNAYDGLIESLVYVDDDSDVGCVVGLSIEVKDGLGRLVVLQPKWMQRLRILFCL